MLKKIELNNYTTFINPTTINFSASNYKFLNDINVTDNKILKGCLFVGENASGKTMILKSITLLLELLFKETNIDFGIYKSFYTKDETYKLKYTFSIDNNEINYSIEFSEDEIVSEKLSLNDKELLNRLGNVAKLSIEKEQTFNNLTKNRPFIRRVYFDTNFYGNKVLNKWFDFMMNSVYVNCYERKVITYSNNSLLVHDCIDDELVTKMRKFLERIGYKQDITFQKYGTNNENKIILFQKYGTKVLTPENIESIGNRTLIELLPSFIHTIENSCMIILDEFSSGFHNELEECLIKYFFSFANNSQIFFTSHSTNLLNNTLLRPDQIYSVSFKSKDGAVLKRFSDEMPRESQNIEKMYLNGVFDGMPRYNKRFKD